MVGGMAPSALGLGAGGEFRSPMAIAVIGGLLVSTLLSLLFVPALFTLMDDLGSLCWGLFRGFIGKENAEPGSSSTVNDAPNELIVATNDHRELRSIGSTNCPPL